MCNFLMFLLIKKKVKQHGENVFRPKPCSALLFRCRHNTGRRQTCSVSLSPWSRRRCVLMWKSQASEKQKPLASSRLIVWSHSVSLPGQSTEGCHTFFLSGVYSQHLLKDEPAALFGLALPRCLLVCFDC